LLLSVTSHHPHVPHERTGQVLENFKSYAGTKTIGPFHKCFSAVVGPNGSGKSNVIDAMLFVFGKRAKKLRLNKVSELIHSSDACRSNPPGYAKVSVHLHEIIDTGDGDDDYEVVPGTGVVVSRVAKRDNSSQYQIDGRNATFGRVSEYLGSRGIDLDNNRFLILQGEVEMISMMPPKGKADGNDEGLLEYLEDIIGSNKYVERANLAAARVEQLGEVRQERLNRVKAAEKEKDSLSGAKAEAESLVNKDREVRRKRNVLYQLHAMHARREGETATEEREELGGRLDEERASLAEADSRVSEIEDGMSGQKREYDDVYAVLCETKEAYARYERQDIQTRENIKHENGNIKKMEDKVATEAKKAEDARIAMDEAEGSIPTLEGRIAECAEIKTVEDENLESIFDETRIVTERLRLELEEKTQELAPMQQERTVYQNSLDTAQMEVDLLEDAVNRASEQLRRAEGELNSLDEKQGAKRAELGECEAELASSKARAERAEAELGESGQRETTLAKRSAELLVSFSRWN
jgi:structural maintenance of chromosome 4